MILMTTPRIAQRNASHYVGQRLPFKGNGSLAGELNTSRPYPGRLPREWWPVLESHWNSLDSGEAGYFVTSYSTPIAWWTPTYGWIAPNVKYSSSTSKQQSYVGLPLTTIKELRASGS